MLTFAPPHPYSRAGARSARYLAWILIVWQLLASSGTAHGRPAVSRVVSARQPLSVSWLEWLSDAFEYTLRALGTVESLGHADSALNPDNLFLQLPNATFGLEGRPDLALHLGELQLHVKPRFEISLEARDGQQGDDVNASIYLLQAIARLSMHEKLFLQVGLDYVQWGPSQFFSPSNPFYFENARGNPLAQVRGSYMAQLVWVHSLNASVSLFANPIEASTEDRYRSFERTVAAKIDVFLETVQWSLILAYGEKSAFQWGTYALWTATDALLVYGEGRIAQNNRVPYPQADVDDLSTGAMQTDPERLDGSLLLGGSYTFSFNLTVALEYLFQAAGYDGADMEAREALAEHAAQDLRAGGEGAGPAAATLGALAQPQLLLLRQHYLMLQARWAWEDEVEVLLRWVQNLEDGASAIATVVGWSLGDRWEITGIGLVTTGGPHSEFRSVLTYQLLAAFQVTY